jgi:acetoacetyl-CoA synthetase
MGTAEIYRTIEALEEIADSLIVNLDLPDGSFFMPLFVKLKIGVEFDDDLKEKINSALRAYSPRHVPDDILEVVMIPYTRTGKKMEVPVRKILMAVSIELADYRDSMAEPGSIDFFADYARDNTIAMFKQS